MTNYKEIETYLKHGLQVGVHSKSGKHLTISPTKDAYGRYRTSDWCNTLQMTKQTIGKDEGYHNLQDACKDWTEITPFHLDFEPYPVGMKVRVIRTGEVEKIIGNSGCIYILLGTNGCYSHTELIPYFEEESLSGQEVSVTIGDKTYKAIIK